MLQQPASKGVGGRSATTTPYFFQPCHLCWFYLYCFYVEFGSFGAPFSSLLAHCWFILTHFWFPLVHFWLTFGALWLTFGDLGSLLAILTLDSLVFGAPYPHFPYFVLQHGWGTSSKTSTQAPSCITIVTFSLVPLPPRPGVPERNLCRRQLRLI